MDALERFLRALKTFFFLGVSVFSPGVSHSLDLNTDLSSG